MREKAKGSNENTQATQLLSLHSFIDHPDAYPTPSEQYSVYSDEITKALAKVGTELEAREFLVDTYILSQSGSVPFNAAIYPPLREYVKRYRKTPELLVTLYDFAGAIPPEDENAGEWLRQANEMEPENEYLLWQRFLSRGAPYFPEELVHSKDLLEEQRWLLGVLAKKNSHDPLALGVQSYLDRTKRSLGSTTEDLEFWNSLRRIAPNPWRHMGLMTMLHYANDPRHIKHRSPQLAKDWFDHTS